jgi:hypothetical protein
MFTPMILRRAVQNSGVSIPMNVVSVCAVDELIILSAKGSHRWRIWP